MKELDINKISKVLSDPIRYQILRLLSQRIESDTLLLCDHPGVCNCEIMAKFDMIQSRVSYHMKELVEANLVLEEPQGKWKYYSLNRQTFHAYIEQLHQDLKL